MFCAFYSFASSPEILIIKGAPESQEIACATRPQARSRSALAAATETRGFSDLIQWASRSIASDECARAAARTSSSSFGRPCGLPVFPFGNGRPRGRPFGLYCSAICCFIVVIANFRPDCTSNPRLVELGRDDPPNGRFRAEPTRRAFDAGAVPIRSAIAPGRTGAAREPMSGRISGTNSSGVRRRAYSPLSLTQPNQPSPKGVSGRPAQLSMLTLPA
jgi:hypothetical protein